MTRLLQNVGRHWKSFGVAVACFLVIALTVWWFSLEPLRREIIKLDYGTSAMYQSANKAIARLVAESDDPLPALMEIFRRYRQVTYISQYRDMLQSEGWEGRRIAAPLKQLLDHEDPWYRECSVRLLLGLHGKEPFEFELTELPILISIVEQNHGLSPSRQAVEAIGRMGPDAKTAIPVLIGWFHNDRPLTNSTLHSIGPGGELWNDSALVEAAVPILIGLLDHDVQTYGRSDGERGYPFGVFERGESEFYDAPVVLLSEIGAPAIPTLIKAIHQEGFRRREKAAIILGHIGPAAKSAVPDLITALKEDEHPRVRRASAHALGKIGPGAKAAIPALTEALNDDPPEIEFADGLPWPKPTSPYSLPSVAKTAIGRIEAAEAGR